MDRVAEEGHIGLADERGKLVGFSLEKTGFYPHLVAALPCESECVCRWVYGDDTRLEPLAGQFFGNQLRDRSRSTGHVHNRQRRTRRACHQRCQGSLNQRTVDCGIKWMGCEGFKRQVGGFLRFKEAHESPLFSLRR